MSPDTVQRSDQLCATPPHSGDSAVQVFPLSDVKAYMGHADIATTMIYVHHVPQVDAAERFVGSAENGGYCKPQ